MKLESRLLLMSTYFGVNREFSLRPFLKLREGKNEILAKYNEPRLGTTLLLGQKRRPCILSGGSNHLYITILKKIPRPQTERERERERERVEIVC